MKKLIRYLLDNPGYPVAMLGFSFALGYALTHQAPLAFTLLFALGIVLCGWGLIRNLNGKDGLL